MQPKGIPDLLAHKKPIRLTVRVIRKYSVQWNPKEKRKLFYLLADAYGNAVEAKVDTRRKRIDSQVFLYRCYVVDGYVVDPPLRFCQVVDAPATIVIGDKTTFQPVEAPDIPKQYFSFVPHGDLKARSEQTELLTDYLCRIENNSSVIKRKDSNVLKMWVIDESNEPIEVTLWENIAYTYANVVAPGKVIAISSLKITKYLGGLQFESTPATTIDVDLAIEGYSEAIKRLKELPKKSTAAYGYQTEEDIRSNVTTLANILSKDPASIHNHRYACVAVIKEIHGHRTWYSSRCPDPQCNDVVRNEDDQLICKHCGDVDKPVYKYCVNATLYNDRSSLPVVFFDNAMRQILGVDCETLVVREGYTDSKVIPKPMLSLIGKEKIFSFSMRQNDDAHIQQILELKPSVTKAVEEASSQEMTSAAPTTPAGKTPKKHMRAEEPADSPPTRSKSK